MALRHARRAGAARRAAGRRSDRACRTAFFRVPTHDVRSANAGFPAAAQLPAITVTADKQERALESLPGSLSVFDGDMLDSQGVVDLEGLQRITPGLTFQPFGQAGVNAAVMRGLSANSFRSRPRPCWWWTACPR
ncbi:hypothetical protein WJ969_07625 [Achromobacter xylosoxidans]